MEEDRPSQISDFEILHELGRGAFGKAYKVWWKQDWGVYTMKVIELSTKKGSKGGDGSLAQSKA